MANLLERVWRAFRGVEITPPPPAVPAPAETEFPAAEVEERLLATAREEGRREAVQELAEEIQRAAARQPIPLIPSANVPSPFGVYQFDQPINYSTPQPPTRRPKSLVTVDTLRQLADTYDVLRAGINHLKREVATTKFEVVPRNAKDASPRTKARCAEAMTLFQTSGPVGGYGTDYRHFESKIVEDVLVVGAAAIYHQRDRVGNWLSCVDVDSATIRPWTDAYGWPPSDDGPYKDHVYEQWVYGVQTGYYSRADMSYDGLWSVSWQPYFRSAVEWLIYVVNSALYADQWNRSWLTDGDTPSDMTALPETWTVDQIIRYQQHWDAMMAGNIAQRRKMKFVPGGSQKVGDNSRKEQDFQEFETWLMRRTLSILGVSPTAIGHEGHQYKVSQEGAQQQTTQFGAGSLLSFRKARLDDILERAGYGDLETQDVADGGQSAKERAETDAVLIGSGQRTINEVRQANGQDPLDGGDTLLVSAQVQTLDSLVNPPEPPPPPTLPPPGPGGPPAPGAGGDDAQRLVASDLKRWQTKALGRLRAGKSADCEFESAAIPADWRETVRVGLEAAQTAAEVRAVFEGLSDYE